MRRRLLSALGLIPAILFMADTAAIALPVLEPAMKGLDNNGPPLERGDLMVYVIEIPNLGADPATSVVFHNPLSADLGSVAVVSIPPGATDESDLVGPAPYVRITGFSVAPGDTATIVISAFVAAAAPGPDVCTQGEVSSVEITTPIATDDRTTAAPADPTCLALDFTAVILTTSKRMVDANGAPVMPGDTLLYTIDIDNVGGVPATSVVARDPIAPEFSAVTVIVTPSGSTDASVLTGPAREVRIQDFDIAAGGRATILFSATLGATASGTVCNQGFIASTEVTIPIATDDPATPAPGDPTCAVLPGVAELTLRKSARDLNGGTLDSGDLILYLLEATNPGTAPVTMVSIQDALPRGLRNLAVLRLPAGAVDRSSSGGPSPLFAADSFTIAPGGTALLAYQAELTPSAPPMLCNQASATSFEVPGPILSDDPATLELLDGTCLLSGAAPALSSILSAADDSGAPTAAGDATTWTVEVRNTGSGNANGVSIRVPLPAGLATVTVTAIPPGATDSSDLTGPAPYILADGFDIAAGQSATLTFTALIAAVPDGTVVCARGEVASTDLAATYPSDDPATRTTADATCLTVGPALSATTKELIDADRGALEPGDLMLYAIDVRNSGSADALGVRVEDALPAGLRNLAVVAIPTGATDSSDLSANPPRLDIAGFDVASAAVARVLVAGEIDAVPPAPDLCNQAVITSATLTTPIPSDDATTVALADPTCVDFGLTPELAVTKEVVAIAGTVPAAPGDLLLYLIRIVNNGSGPARAVRVVDALVDLVEPEIVSLPAGATDLSDPLASPPLVLVEIPRIESGSSVLVAFLTRIAPIPTAARICNRALVSARELIAVIGSDDPLTATAFDATCLDATPQPGLPTVSSILPCLGTKKGGTEVTISGTGFQPGVTVTFDGLAATVLSVSATEIVVLTPAHPPVGAVEVVVTNPDGNRVTVSPGFIYTPPPFPIQLGGKRSGGDAWLIWTGGTGTGNVILRSNSPDFDCSSIDAKTSATGSLVDSGKGKNKSITYYRVE